MSDGATCLDKRAAELGPEQQGERKSRSTRLVEIAQESYRFGISTEGEAYAIPRTGPQVVTTLRGARTSLRNQLSRRYFEEKGRAASQQALADALLVIEGLAQDAEPEPLYLRVAESQGGRWFDLGDSTGRAVKITADGWHVVDTPPVLFKRTALMSPIPDPERGGALDQLWRLLNVAPADRPLIAAWLVGALYGELAHPVLSLFGEQGTGKTTAQRMLVDLIDPSPVPTRKAPRDAESWVTAAAGSWVVGLDNLSVVPDWLSDSICRAVTGDGDVRRRLYTDGEHAVFSYRRCIVLNGIDLGALRGDLAERLLPIELETISERHRMADHELWPVWREALPRILGALLDLATRVAGVLPELSLESRPRMADFAEIVAAVDQVLGTHGLDRYLGKQQSIATDSLTADPFIAAIMENVEDFEGTAAKLLDRLNATNPPKGWPTNARAVTQLLNRHAPALRKAGWHVSNDGGANHAKVLRWTLRPEKTRERGPQDPQDPLVASECGLEDPHPTGVASQTPAPKPGQTRAMPRSAGVAGNAGVESGDSQDGASGWEVDL